MQTRLCIILLLCLVPLLSTAQAKIKKDTTWIETTTGCKVYNPHPIKNETIAWSGDCIDGYANGEGVLIWYRKGNKSDVYKGQMRRGKLHGKGRYVYVDGSSYEGEYVNGYDDGHGLVIQLNNDGSISFCHNGEFKMGRPHGYGVMTYFYHNGDTSSIYKGYFSDWHIKHGYGVLKTYVGNNVTITQGEFNNNKPQGVVEILQYEKGKLMRHYKGSFQSEQRNGRGEEIYGVSKYSGDWKQDKKEGSGKLMMDTLLIYDGEWKNDKFDGIGKRFYFDGSYYFGEFRKNQREGFGVLYWKDGSRYVGEFSKDLFFGSGYIVKNNAVDFAGIWENGSLMIRDNLKVQQLNYRYRDMIKQLGINSNSD
jgi:hypothetical protein